MASSRKKAETKATAASRAGRPAARPGIGRASDRKAATPAASAVKKPGATTGGTGRSGSARPSPGDDSGRARKAAAASAARAKPAAAAQTKPRVVRKATKAEKPRPHAKPAAAPPKAARVGEAKPAPAPKPAPKTVTRPAKAVPTTSGPPAAPADPRRATRARKAGDTAGAKTPARRRGATARRPASADAAEAPHAVEGLSEEDQIRAAKYLPRELPKRLFEEERFIFPETYGVNRIRLLVRDPEWIFAYWDVSPAAMKEFAKSIGERALALSRLTLRVIDPVSGGSTDILLPPGARWWYVRTDQSRRTYRAELGVTLPSGEFRRLAESNTVVTPRVGPSPERARRRLSYPEARELPLSAAAAASEAEKRTGVALEPWEPGAVEGAETPSSVAGRTTQGVKGGASDTFRPGGAGDAFPGASDTFRR